jgi:hypothetical protein
MSLMKNYFIIYYLAAIFKEADLPGIQGAGTPSNKFTCVQKEL